jgi:hypothetical protein
MRTMGSTPANAAPFSYDLATLLIERAYGDQHLSTTYLVPLSLEQVRLLTRSADKRLTPHARRT